MCCALQVTPDDVLHPSVPTKPIISMQLTPFLFSYDLNSIIIIIITTTIFYSAVIVTEVIARVHSVHLVNVEQRQAAADPQTKPRGLGCESACFRQLSSSIAIYYYY